MPEPRSKETKSQWMERCMADAEQRSSFPDRKQRVAVCESKWKNRTSDAATTVADAEKSNFGWSKGDKVRYTYRSAKDPEGTVTSVHPGTTKKNTTIGIDPKPHWKFGEGHITRHLENSKGEAIVFHISKFSSNADDPPDK